MKIEIKKTSHGDYLLEKETTNINPRTGDFFLEEISNIEALELYELAEDIQELLKDKYPKIN